MFWPTAPLWRLYLEALLPLLAIAFGGWLASVPLKNVSIVDGLWSLLFLAVAVSVATGVALHGPLATRAWIVLASTAVWALRLSLYITSRNRGHGEDRRYQAIRARNQPGFAWKSLYLVFILQALLAFVIAQPLYGAIVSPRPLSALDLVAAGLFAIGFVFEAGGDWQLARFKADPANRGRVMDRGLWRYTRHPNYFGDCCIWWALYLFAGAAGAWWSVLGPLLMTVLLLRVSGVALLEKDIGERRPDYAEYIRRTNAFLPGPVRRR